MYSIVPDLDPEYYYYKSEGIEYSDEDVEQLSKERGLTVEARLAIDLDSLEGVCIYRDGDASYTVNFDSVESLVALMADARIRYKYEGDDLLEYCMNLFGPVDGYDPPRST